VSYRVRILPEAEEQARELYEWWESERPASQTNVKGELHQLSKRLARFPNRYPRYEDRDVRWCQLKGTPYYAFFRVDDEAREVEVICVWGGSRGRGPEFDR
jgi:plasmid stabilization system protein ParE